ncbi:hypothetical protein [Candidatus Electronema sp. TJ]|uniref:hypothetical protein n=1 Tax=Candidatus Electronema sp. TJ TaxID=3401573 RepID=UPI003AA84CC4
MTGAFRELTGFRGEKIVELCLTDYQAFDRPLFRPGFLGDKWPAVDFYVELEEVEGKRLYFFAQTKATADNSSLSEKGLHIYTKRRDIENLLQIPGPTYIFGVHEPTKRVFIRSIHSGIPVKAISRIPLTHELTSINLKKLHNEVCRYWSTTIHKPVSSVFA